MRFRFAALIGALLFAAPVSAQVVAVTHLPPATTLTGTEVLPTVQAAQSRKVTTAQIATLANANTQPLDAELTSIAGLTTAADKCDYWNALHTAALYSCTAYMRGVANSADAAALTSQLNPFSSSLKGLAPASGGGTTNFLRADGTWAAPAGGAGTVTSVSVTTANGVSGSVATSTSTPAITLTLGAITPTSVVASGSVTGSNLSGTNTGDQTTVTGNAGTATKWATARTIAITGDLAYTSPSLDGSANVTAGGTLATVNSNIGACGSVSASPTITLDAKGRATACTATEINPVGAMMLAPSAPSARWLLADGTAYSQATYPALYSAIGAQPDFAISTVAVAGASVVGVAFNGTTYVASTSAGLYSATSLSGPWTQRETHVYTATVPTWDGTNFLVIDNSGTGLYYSPDGITWSSVAVPASAGFGQIYYLNGVYFFLPSNIGSATSLYSSTTAGGLSGYTLRFTATVGNVVYGGGKYVAAGGTVIRYSSDGVTWSTSTVANDYGFTKTFALYTSGNTFLVFGNSGRIYKSTDGGVNFAEIRPWGVTGNLTLNPHYDGTNVFLPSNVLTQWYASSDTFATTPRSIIPQRSYYNALLTVNFGAPYYSGDKIVAGSSGGYLFVIDKYSYNKATSFVVPNATPISIMSAPEQHWYIYAGP